MSITTFRSNEALYLVIVREKNAEQMLKTWAKESKTHVVIENNRMKLFEQRSLILFQMNWSGDWNNVTIWDCWKRQHINLT